MMTIDRTHGIGPISVTSAVLATVCLIAAPAHASRHSDTAAIAGGDVEPPIALRGLVVDRAGRPIAGAAIEILDFAATRPPGRHIATGVDGRFAIASLARRSVLLRISQAGHYPEIVPVDLQRPVRTTAVSTGPIVLTARAEGRTRLMFVGDMMFGRRLVDDDQDGVEGELTDIIHPGKRADDAERAVTFVRDALASADYTMANLECVVTDNPATPHPYKPYTLHSHPDTLAGLKHAGIDGISSGNNHVFDFLASGVADTINFVAAAGLDDSGADMNESMARTTTIRAALNGVDVALQGLSEMRYDGNDTPQYHLVARDPAKAGALYASHANLHVFLAGAREAFAVPLIHGGEEYSRYPTDDMRKLFIAAIEGGAGLVVSHHPHVLHGVGVVDGGGARRFVLMSLGNFLFDQDTHETIDSVIAMVDVDALPGGGHHVARVELLPVVIDQYLPKLLAGEAVARLGRKLAHLSTTLPDHPQDSARRDGLRGAIVFPRGSRVVALKNPAQYRIAEQDERVRLAVHGGATPTTSYARSGAADFLARVRTRAPATLELGRELLRYGDFEDHDVDGEVGEQIGWFLGPSVYTQTAVVRRGARALALRRHAHEDEAQALQTRRRVPLFGDHPLTIRGHVRGHHAGRLTVRARFYRDDEWLGDQEVHSEPGGTYGWTRFAASLQPPNGASGMHLSFRQGLPKGQVGAVYLDDIAVVQWEQSLAHAEHGLAIATPNDWSFYRFTGASGRSLAATLTHRAYAEN